MHAGVQGTILSDHMIHEIHLATLEEHQRYSPGWKFNDQLLEKKGIGERINKIMARILDETQLCNGPVEVLAKQGEILNMFKRVSKRIGRARAKRLRQQKQDLERRRLRAMQRIQELELREQPLKENRRDDKCVEWDQHGIDVHV